MPYIYENDVTQTGGNLQKTVAYLLSLHKNEYEWNLLGIKVVGHVDALPIPDSDYEYGDAYTVGTATPYDMWIYTRADATHPQDYWFNVGKFPAPGPQGPAGPSLIDVTDFQMDAVQRVDYDATTGADVESAATLKYKDPNTGESKKDTIDTMKIKLPIVAGDDIGIDANADGDALTIKVDEMELAQKFFKIDKTKTAVPAFSLNYGIIAMPYSFQPTPSTLLRRGASGEAAVKWLRTDEFQSQTSPDQHVTFPDMYQQLIPDGVLVRYSETNEGQITAAQLKKLRTYPLIHIRYGTGEIFYRKEGLEQNWDDLEYTHIGEYLGNGNVAKPRIQIMTINKYSGTWKLTSYDLELQGNSGAYIPVSDSTTDVIPVCKDGEVSWSPVSEDKVADSIVKRDANGDIYTSSIYASQWSKAVAGGLKQIVPFDAAYNNAVYVDYTIAKTVSDTGTLTSDDLTALRGYKNRRIVYDGKLYYRMDPTNAPDGTLSYIHIDSTQDGSGGYKATGKCFSITVSTRAWQVIDLNFQVPSVPSVTHNILLKDKVSNTQVRLQIINNSENLFTVESFANYIGPEDNSNIIPVIMSTNGNTNWVQGTIERVSDTTLYVSLNPDNSMTEGNKSFTLTQLEITDKTI